MRQAFVFYAHEEQGEEIAEPEGVAQSFAEEFAGGEQVRGQMSAEIGVRLQENEVCDDEQQENGREQF